MFITDSHWKSITPLKTAHLQIIPAFLLYLPIKLFGHLGLGTGGCDSLYPVSFIEILRIVACRCAQDGRPVTWLTRSGRFLGRLEGPVSGNVLLRRAQHQALDSPSKTLEVARNLVAGKLKKQRNVILRSAREADNPKDRELLSHTARLLADTLLQLPGVTDLDTLRGMEGDAARHYFAGFSSMLRTGQKTFAITGRTRRPPLDPTNALLSFLYALLLNDCVAGAQGVGLDPQMGFLHSLRPGGLPWDWTSWKNSGPSWPTG